MVNPDAIAATPRDIAQITEMENVAWLRFKAEAGTELSPEQEEHYSMLFRLAFNRGYLQGVQNSLNLKR
jgi:hypothetical protein